MYNLVIFSNDLKLIKKICTVVCLPSDNVNLKGIVDTENELSILCKNTKIDIIIIQRNIALDNGLSKLLNNIENKIIILDNLENLRNSKYTLYIPSDQLTNISSINKIKNFLSKVNEESIRKRTIMVLHNFSFDFKLSGTKYLVESIVHSYINREKCFFENLQNKIYPLVSKKYKVSVQNIKWSIIRSINNMKLKVSIEQLEKFNINSKEQLTTKYIISEIINLL